MKIKSINQLIEKYPKIFQDYQGNPLRVNWDCPEGWLDIVDTLCEQIQSRSDHVSPPDPQVTCTQVKEKFGGLRFYVNGASYFAYGMIQFAEALSTRTCIHCGSMEDIKMKAGWISPVCAACVKERGYTVCEEPTKAAIS